MGAKKQASVQAARAARGRKRKHAKERNEILCNNLSLPKHRRDDKSFTDDFRRTVDFHLLIRELWNGCHYCWQRSLLLSEGILQDQRSQSPDKIQILCRSWKGLSHVSTKNSILSVDMELSVAILQENVLFAEQRTLIAEHANNQCEWVDQQLSTIVVRTTAEVLKLWRLAFQRSFLEKETTGS